MMSMRSFSGRWLAGLLLLVTLPADGRGRAEEDFQCRCHGGLGHEHDLAGDAFAAETSDQAGRVENALLSALAVAGEMA